MSSRQKIIYLTVILAVLFFTGAVQAAWRDAPAGPPNYGSSPCLDLDGNPLTYEPCLQEDYKPVNLGDATQTKSGGLNILGSVGIGTESLGSLLHVYAPAGATSRQTIELGPGGYAVPMAQGSYSDGDKLILFSDANNKQAIGMDANANIWFSSYANTMSDPTGGGFSFYTQSGAGTVGERVRITENGNVGIGTTGPSAKLAIGDTGSPGDTIAAYANSSRSTLYAEQLGSGYAIYSSGGLNYFSGNIGIGTTTPVAPLHIVSSSNATLKLEKTGANPTSLTIENVGDNIIFRNTRVAGDHLIIHNSGKVGIGIIDTLSTLGVYGNAAVGTGYAGVATAPNDGMIIQGNVGIGTTTPGLYKLNVAGDIYTSGSGTAADGWFVSSDARLKKNVETLSGALEKIGRVRGVSYDLASGQGARQIGVIAQELEQEFPELVKTDSNGYKAVAYDRLSAVLIEAVKELKAQNQALQSRLDQLEKKW